MLKNKILISLLTGSVSLVSLGTIAVVSNPAGTSNWIARNIMGSTDQAAADDGLMDVFSNWIASTVPVESTAGTTIDSEEIEATEGTGATENKLDAQASATMGAASAGQTGTQTYSGPVDAVASATAQRIESVLNSAPSGAVDAVASASVLSTTTPGGTGSSTSGSGTTTTVDAIASASLAIPAGTASPESLEGLISLEQAIALAQAEIKGSTFRGYEFENDYPPVFEIFLTTESAVYEVEIHAVTGAVLEVDSESLERSESDGESDGESADEEEEAE